MPGEAGGDLAAAGQAALDAFDRALAAQPERDGPAFTALTDHLCRMRDLLVAERRRGGAPSPRLEQLNGIISTALAGHFPLGKAPWPAMEQARIALHALVKDSGRAAG